MKSITAVINPDVYLFAISEISERQKKYDRDDFQRKSDVSPRQRCPYRHKSPANVDSIVISLGHLENEMTTKT